MKQKVQIVGVLNVTPDSYWDGGKYTTAQSAVRRAGELIEEGADIIEVGGESTGPSSHDVPLSVELERTLPIIRAIKQTYPEARLSVDTYKSEVANAALGAGAVMINDVTAGRSDPAMFSAVAGSDAALVLMYAKDASPRTTKQEASYDDVIHTVCNFLQERTDAALKAGVPRERIIIDPGLGHFISSDPTYSFEIIARLNEISQLGFPVFISPSRKSFLEGSENLTTEHRLPGTIVASAFAAVSGATYIRTHDVAAVRRGIEVAQAIMRQYF